VLMVFAGARLHLTACLPLLPDQPHPSTQPDPSTQSDPSGENDKLIWPHVACLIWPHPAVG